MIYTYKILSVLLDYPTQETLNIMHQMPGKLKEEGLLDKSCLDDVSKFMDYFAQMDDITSWQQYYSSTFDTQSLTSLYMFDHIHGDSKDKGLAMVDLKMYYKSKGMEMDHPELPDYLPVFLEFISETKTPLDGAKLLAESKKILEDIRTKLAENESAYRYLLNCLIYLASKV